MFQVSQPAGPDLYVFLSDVVQLYELVRQIDDVIELVAVPDRNQVAELLAGSQLFAPSSAFVK